MIASIYIIASISKDSSAGGGRGGWSQKHKLFYVYPGYIVTRLHSSFYVYPGYIVHLKLYCYTLMLF